MAQGPENTVETGEMNPQHAAWRALPKRLFIALAAFDTLLVLAYFAMIALDRNHNSLFAVLNLDKEANLPSWFAGAQLLIIAVGYLVLGSRLIPDRRKVTVLRPLWLALGIGFVLLSADEVSAIHERMGRALRRFHFLKVHIFNIKGLDQWMVLYLLIALCLVLIFSKQLIRAWREWRVEALLFVLGFGVLVGGAFIAEMAQIMFRWEGGRLLLEAGFEEWLEMFGASILVLPAYRILSYAMTSDPDLESEALGG